MRRVLGRTLIIVILLLAVIVGGGYFYLRQSLPMLNGEVRVTGTSGPIEIVRDADAIPHIFAATKADALFGLGYVHAQDRLWQMEFQRRIGHGRLSEVFGAAALPQDRFLRTVGFGRTARSAWQHLPNDVRAQIDAYLNGVNAFIASHHGRQLPPEFTLLRFEPEPFTGPDVLVWVKMMSWDLSANYSLELMRHDILARVGPERMADLLPPYPGNGLSIVTAPDFHVSPGPPPASEGAAQARLTPTSSQSLSDALAQSLSAGNDVVRALLLGGGRTESLGSNNWVVDGTMTASGKPLLANDPHLGAHMPSLWYLAHLSAGDFDVIGATLPGAPAIAIGRNRRIAWGETNVAADVQDLFVEKLDANGTHAEFRGAQESITVVPETIVVKGGAPVTVNVRITRHGPLVSDAVNANNESSRATPPPAPLEPMALRWTTLDAEDSTVTAFMRLNEASNWNDFTGAMRELVAPSQNFVYADVDGHIGYYAPGRIPVRARGDGARPADGASGDYEWTSYVPFEELPHAFDPPDHFIISANNRPMPADYPHLIGAEFPDPWRAERITELLRGRTGLTPDTLRDIQADTLSLHARHLVPLLLERVAESPDRTSALTLLRQWDFNARSDSAAAAIFQAWFLKLAPALVGDELGPALASYEGRFSYVSRFLTTILESGSSPWCDDVTTTVAESCQDTVTRALDLALADVKAKLGGEPPTWRWDALHRAIFPHQGLDSVGALRPFLSRSVPASGDWSTVNVGAVAADAPYEQHSVPGFREIVDLSPLNDSRFADAVGESGHFLSPHYDDFLPDWKAVGHKKMRMDRAEIDAGSIGRLRLVPQH